MSDNEVQISSYRSGIHGWLILLELWGRCASGLTGGQLAGGIPDYDLSHTLSQTSRHQNIEMKSLWNWICHIS